MTKTAFLVPIAVEDLVLARLAFRSGGTGRSVNQFAADLKVYAPKQHVVDAVEQLVAAGLMKADPKVTPTADGKLKAKAIFGDTTGGQRRLENVILPALALGLDPKSASAKRLSRGENLRAVALARAFKLHVSLETITLSQAIGIILARSAAGFPVAVSSESSSGIEPQTTTFTELAALRKALVKSAVSLSVKPESDTDGDDDDNELDAFASRVKEVAAKLETPPFSHKVSISQVYDAYGRAHRDVGSLDAFKTRLYRAAIKDHLTLLPLNDPSAMSEELKARSEIPAGLSPLHFVEARRV